MTFHKATKSLAKQLDPAGELIPLRSIIDQNSFRPCFLIQRKPKTSFWQTCPYHKTDYKLWDVLLPGHFPAQIDVQDSFSYTIVDQVDGTLEGTVGENMNITNVEVKGSTNSKYTRSVKVKKIQVHPNFLDSVTGKGKINMDHEFIKQAKKFQRNLYVIIEAIETVEEAQFEETNILEGSIFHKTCIKLHLMATRKKQTVLTIPKSCILAFRVKKLEVQNDGSIAILHFPDKEAGFFRFESKRCAYKADSVVIEFGGEKEDLEAEVRRECKHFSLLATDLRGLFLTGFVAIMKEDEKDLLHTLESQLEQALEDPKQFKLEASEPELQILVGNLHDSSGAIITELVESVLYFLEALNELTKFQILLLVDSVEKGIVSKQLVLVTQILDHDFNKKGSSTADVQFLTEDDLNITGVLMEMSEVTVRKSGSNLAGTGRPADLSNLSALYVALYILNLLSR